MDLNSLSGSKSGETDFKPTVCLSMSQLCQASWDLARLLQFFTGQAASLGFRAL